MNPDATNIGLTVIALSALVSLAGGLMNIFGRTQKRDIGPMPLQVSAAEKYVTEQRLKEHAEANDQRAAAFTAQLSEIAQRFELSQRNSVESSRLLHRRLNVISQNVATIAGCVAHANGQPLALAREGVEG